MAWDSNLDPKSVAYEIAASPDSRIRVIAGPGTGKSFAMKRRVARLLEANVKPKDILAVTFTRVAAQDLHREMTQLGVPGCQDLKGRTLHSLGLQILARQHVLTALGRIANPINRFEEDALICDLHSSYGGKKQTKKLLAGYLAAWATSQGAKPGFVPGSVEGDFAKDVLAWLEFHEAMLIGEIIPYLHLYLKQNPAAKERTEFSNIVVDEFQDLNIAEQTIIQYLSGNANVLIVGDDDQSIYSFKHAHPEGIRDWPTSNPGAKDFALLDCHRCPTRVVDMANSLIAMNKQRSPRKLNPITANGPGNVEILQFNSIDAEAAGIASRVRKLIDQKTAKPGEIIVLVQRAVIGKRIMEALRTLKVPVKSYYDESQLDTDAAQERFALFKLLMDSDDRAALRFLLGFGGTHLRASAYSKLRDYCEITGAKPWNALLSLQGGTLTIQGTTVLVKRFGEISTELTQLQLLKGSLSDFIDYVFPSGIAPIAEVRQLALECSVIAADVDELFEMMMDELTQPEAPPPINDVRLMSLHKSKGLSVPYVFIAGCVQGLLPRQPDVTKSPQQRTAELEEQRRLFYVGLTRVKSDLKSGHAGRLYLTYCRHMGAGLAKQAGIVPASSKGGKATLISSSFLGELGSGAPQPSLG